MQMPPLVIAEHPVDGGMMRLAVSGELDLASADDLEKAVAAAARRTDLREVLVELSGVTFLDASGIAALSRARTAARAAGVLVRAEGARGVVARVLAVTGVGEWLASA
ncbi:STAS domain-containing protein [Couchioplanes caeruleus]|uniref:STAS domain-containing protein n=1 Tax=Couchioplanes caeruleus TaxID=56438 RepID=UPI0020BE9FE9|nr:STAS domain-containing protein [Couchioplanes caeruleus]UQU61974.1 STAS domain-containing protein [Couchioplanes caeruleus]